MNLQTEALMPAVQPATSHAEGRQVIFQPSTVQRVLLQGVSWATYEQLLGDFVDSHAAHFAYDQGTLEIMVLSPKHEALKHTLSLLVEVIAEELSKDVYSLGSTTFRRQDLARGFEPDACFYFHAIEHIREREQINLNTDPVPDLVIEIDITSPSLEKFPIFAALAIPEVWRYDGTSVAIFRLNRGKYQARQESSFLPGVTADMLTQFMDEGKMLKRPLWLRRVREGVRKRKTPGTS